jgi:DNA-binding IclR family transcriptional regulator
MPEVGIEIPAHASALGKALLAFTPDAEGALLADPRARRSMTGETVTEPAALRSQLAAVRQTGLAEEVEEAVLGECGVAAVLGGANGEVIGAVGLVVPVADWPVPPSAVDALRAAARAVCRELGATAWPPPAPTSLGASA